MRMRAVLRWLAIGAGLVLVVAVGLGWAAYRKFSANIRTDRTSVRLLARDAVHRPRALVPRARNVLVLSAAGARSPWGPRSAEGAVLLHLSAGRDRATALAVPRDLMVRAPDCSRPDGGTSPAAYEPFSAAYATGGAACSIRAFEALTGIRVDHHLVVDRRGFQRIAAAVAGPGPDRPDRRGELLRALAREARGAGGPGLAHPARLYGILDKATSSITADPGLSSLPALYELAGALRSLPADGLVFRTVPAAADRSGAAVPREPDADRLFAAVRADRPA